MGAGHWRFEHHGAAMKTRAIASPLSALLVAAISFGLISGCGKAKESPSAKAGEIAVSHDAGRWAAEKRFANFDGAHFSRPSEVTNEWMPMRPGMRLTYEGSSVDDEGKVISRRMQINVTDLTKMISGVRSVVSWDLDWSEGELVEAELAFFAQDDSGNVWLMGEYPEEYEGGKLTANPGWVHGIEGAKAGIMMLGRPELGTPSYSQGWGPAVGYTDRALVDSVGRKTCVPADCYDDVLVIVEGSAEEVNAEQLKYYARGVGNVRVGWRGTGETEKQARLLTKVEVLDAKGLAEIRAKALELEKSGYANSKKMYGLTPPLERASGR